MAQKKSVSFEELKNEVFFNFNEKVDSMKKDILVQMSRQVNYIPKTIEGDYLLRVKWLKENKTQRSTVRI